MQDQEQKLQQQANMITKLKANLFDCNEQISELNGILQAVVNVTRIQPDEGGNVTPQKLIEGLIDIMSKLPAVDHSDEVISQ